MTDMIDDIKRDRENGTPGTWVADGEFMEDGYKVRVALPPQHGIPGAFIAQCSYDWEEDQISWKAAECNARRIARVPDMESAMLAAEELAEACEDAFDGIDATGPQEFYLALAAYRAATTEGQDQ